MRLSIETIYNLLFPHLLIMLGFEPKMKISITLQAITLTNSVTLSYYSHSNAPLFHS